MSLPLINFMKIASMNTKCMHASFDVCFESMKSIDHRLVKFDNCKHCLKVPDTAPFAELYRARNDSFVKQHTASSKLKYIQRAAYGGEPYL